ncbi:MAG: hypothetical protein GY679_01290 [Mycoplasma sp.]|nr:hypothetical protein [Mycoplasma sp.]
MAFVNTTFRPNYAGSLPLGSQQFRNYTSVNTSVFFNSDLRPNFVGVVFAGSLNFRTGEVLEPTIITPFLQTFFQIYGRDGGLKKVWYYNQDSDSPAMSLKIEVTKNGSGSGTLKLAYLDFPIFVEDIIVVFIGGEIFYKGFFENDVDVSEPTGKISPVSKRLKEILYTGTFTLDDPRDILESVITATASETGISWNNAKVDFEDALDPVTIEYQAESVYSIVDEMVDRGFNKFWGVDTEDDFFVEEAQTTIPTQTLYLGENPKYGGIKVKEDYGKIKMTEAAVYAKRTVTISGEEVTQTELIGTVGTGGAYPVLDLRKKFRKIQGKLTAPEVLTSDTAVLNWAYGRLTEREAIVRKTITLKDYDIVNYPLSVGDTIKVEDKDKLTILDLDVTESLLNWSGVTLSVGGGRFSNDAISVTSGYYDLKDCTKWYRQESIGFFMKGLTDQVVNIYLSENPTPTTSEKTTIVLRTTGTYGYYSINLNRFQEFRYIIFDVQTGPDIIVDSISTFCYHRLQHTEQVSSITVEYQPAQVKSTVKLGDLIDDESYDSFVMDRKIRILERIDRI